MAATLFAYYLCEVAALATKLAFSSALQRAVADLCFGFFGRIWDLHRHMWETYHGIFPFRYIPYGNDKIRGDDVTA